VRVRGERRTMDERVTKWITGKRKKTNEAGRVEQQTLANISRIHWELTVGGTEMR